jgi:hypothetical protein
MKKKPISDFLARVVEPIEAMQVDDGNVYLLIRSRLDLKFREDRTAYYEYVESDIDESNFDRWSLPKGGEPGDWQGAQSSVGRKDRVVRLLTLSGIVWHGDAPGNLYRVEHRGEARKLSLSDFLLYSKFNLTPSQASKIAAQEYIDECIPLGLRVAETRLISKVENWTPSLLWSFAVDCAEHCLSLHRPSDTSISRSYGDALEFARAYAKYRCQGEQSEIEQQVGGGHTAKEIDSLIERKRIDLLNSIRSQVVERDPLTGSLGRGILALLEYTARIFEAVQYARVQNAWSYQLAYQSEYELPDFPAPGSLQEDSSFSRTWYAFMKQELDWQVSHLRGMLHPRKPH